MLEKKVQALGLFYDNLHGYSVENLRKLTNLYALLYESIIINDSWTATNLNFQKLLQEKDGAELLRSGIITPYVRNTCESMEEAVMGFIKDSMHGLQASSLETAKFVDQNAPRHFFSMSDVKSSFLDMNGKALTLEYLVEFGISEDSAKSMLQMYHEAKSAEVHTNNTFFKDQICPHFSEEESQKLMDLVRAPYSLALPSALDIGVISVDEFHGSEVMTLLNGNKRSSASLGVGSSKVQESAYSFSFKDPLISWLLSDKILSVLSAEYLAAARSVSDRSLYIMSLAKFLSTPSQANWTTLVSDMEKYLKQAAQVIWNMKHQRQQIDSDPEEYEVIVKGSSSVQIHRPDETTEITGLSDGDEEVQVFARRIDIPKAE